MLREYFHRFPKKVPFKYFMKEFSLADSQNFYKRFTSTEKFCLRGSRIFVEKVQAMLLQMALFTPIMMKVGGFKKISQTLALIVHGVLG